MNSDRDLPVDLEREIVAFLSSHALPGPVTRVDTHGARVFIGREETLKIKRPVRYAYMDFSTMERRRLACEREYELGRGLAPALYLGVVRITREKDGSLALDGEGEVIEHAVRLKTFDPKEGLDRIAAREQLPDQLSIALGDAVADAHEKAEPRQGGRSIVEVRDRLLASVDARRFELGATAVDLIVARSLTELARSTSVLAARRKAGAVKRCHGDMHLANIVRIDGRPVLFDAIEFDEDLATIDPLYDLAFLLMDLVHRGQLRPATLILNRYLWRLGDCALSDRSWDALAALPLMICLRALVRAVVGVDRARDLSGEARDAVLADARAYLDTANRVSKPLPPLLVAIGGLSGTGKSTVSACLAPGLGAMPGAIHLRSDLERKGLAGIEPEARLGPAGYTEELTRHTYQLVFEKARRALAAGHAVIADAVFARADERAAIESVASGVGVPFHGFWLTVPPELARSRIQHRSGDASDATVDVFERQQKMPTGRVDWTSIDASGAADAIAARIRLLVGA